MSGINWSQIFLWSVGSLPIWAVTLKKKVFYVCKLHKVPLLPHLSDKLTLVDSCVLQSLELEHWHAAQIQ